MIVFEATWPGCHMRIYLVSRLGEMPLAVPFCIPPHTGHQRCWMSSQQEFRQEVQNLQNSIQKGFVIKLHDNRCIGNGILICSLEGGGGVCVWTLHNRERERERGGGGVECRADRGHLLVFLLHQSSKLCHIKLTPV